MTQTLIQTHHSAWIEVYNQADKVDPEQNYIWEGVIIGWAIGRGMTIAEAHAFYEYLYHEKKYI